MAVYVSGLDFKFLTALRTVFPPTAEIYFFCLETKDKFKNS